jgi:hypothetical protein
MKTEIEKDLWDWITNYIEVNHKFYDYKFPPCPYAKAARLKGLVDVSAYTSGSITKFITEQTNDLIDGNKFNVRVMVFPAWMRWLYPLHWFIQRMNKRIVPKDFYAQYGKAVNTQSKYPDLSKGLPYFIVIVNKLSDVMSGHSSLVKTEYYNHWTDKHFTDVVVRRQKIFEKYNKE